MLVEQSFFHLPEILTGGGYPSQEYEGGVVSAFSLALLQQLNGRNVPNPLASLQSEKLYRTSGFWQDEKGATRYLRADLHLNTGSVRVGSDRLATYGWRHSNWIEAKFFRGTQSIQTQNTASLLADLLRVIALIPHETKRRRKGQPADDRLLTGRYLLHVYDGSPSDYLSVRKKTSDGLQPRIWLSALISPGRHDVVAFQLGDEAEGILDRVSPYLADISLACTVTTFVLEPAFVPKDSSLYTCVLSRIDAFTMALGNWRWEVRLDRTHSDPYRNEGSVQLGDIVGRYINLKGEIETKKPDAVELESDDSEEVDVADSAEPATDGKKAE